MEAQNVYLTGASGFFGGQLLRDMCGSPERFGKIYLPVRSKKGVSGEKRFAGLFGGYGAGCTHCDGLHDDSEGG